MVRTKREPHNLALEDHSGGVAKGTVTTTTNVVQ